MNTKYKYKEVTKKIDFINGVTINRGDVLTIENGIILKINNTALTNVLSEKLKVINVDSSSFFKDYIEPIVPYVVGDRVLYQSKYKDDFNNMVGKIVEITQHQGRFNQKVIVINFGGQKTKTIHESSFTEITKITPFWFINSDGDVCEDYLERVKLKTVSLEFKKKVGNYFTNIEDARKKLDNLLK